MRHHRALGRKSLGVLSFLFEIRKRNQQREIRVLVTGLFETHIQLTLDQFPNSIAPWLDHHAAARLGILREIRGSDHLLVPLGKILSTGRTDGIFIGGHVGCRIGTMKPGKSHQKKRVISGWGFDSPRLLCQVNQTSHQQARMSENTPPIPKPSIPIAPPTPIVLQKPAVIPSATDSANSPNAAPLASAVTPISVPSPAVSAAPRPASPAPTIPLRPAGAPIAPGAPAPTIPLRPAGAPATPGAPAPTIPLRPAAAPAKPGAPTINLAPGSAPKPANTVPILPQATIPIKPPTTPGAALPTPKVASVEQQESEEEEEAETNNGVVTILAGLGLAASIVVLVTQLMVASNWINAEDNPNAGQWSQILPF